MTGQHRDIAEPHRLLPWAIGWGCLILVTASLGAMRVGDSLSVTADEPDASRTVARTTTAARTTTPAPLIVTPPEFPTPADVLNEFEAQRTPEAACARCGERVPMLTAAPERPVERRSAPRTTTEPPPVLPEPSQPVAAPTTTPPAEPTLEPAPEPAPTTEPEPTPTEPAPTTPPLIDLPDIELPLPTQTPAETTTADETEEK